MDADRLLRTVSDLRAGTATDLYYARTISVQVALSGTTEANFIIKFCLMIQH